MENKKHIFVYLSLTLIAFLCFFSYGNSLNGKFIWDDNFMIVNNNFIKNWQGITKILTKDIGYGVGQKVGFFRPLQLLTYMMDYSIWKLNPIGYHLTNIFLHILVGYAVFWLLNILYKNIFISLAASLFFIVCPAGVEAVAYIAGRADILATLFILLSFIFYLKYIYSHKINFYIIMLIAFIFALLSRENSLVFPLLLLSYHWIFKKRLDFKSIAPFVLVIALYSMSRIFFIQVYPVKTTTTLFQRIPGFFYALCNYINLLIFPHDLHMEYGMKLFHFSNPIAITGIVLLSVSIAIIFMVKETNKIIAFSLTWFIVGFLPMSNLYPINAYMAEHWLYLPSIGFFSVLAYLAYLLFKKNKIVSVILVLSLTYFYSVLTIKQNNYWQEPISFFKRTLHYAPDSYNVYINMAVAYTDLGQTKEAIAAYKQAIEIAPKKAKAYSNLGGLYAKIGNNQEAERFIKKAIELDPNYISAYLNLATIYMNTGKIEEAITAYKQVAKIEPGNAKAYYSLGEISKNGGSVWNSGAGH